VSAVQFPTSFPTTLEVNVPRKLRFVPGSSLEIPKRQSRDSGANPPNFG
jgi:hypothetical protein